MQASAPDTQCMQEVRTHSCVAPSACASGRMIVPAAPSSMGRMACSCTGWYR